MAPGVDGRQEAIAAQLVPGDLGGQETACLRSRNRPAKGAKRKGRSHLLRLAEVALHHRLSGNAGVVRPWWWKPGMPSVNSE